MCKKIKIITFLIDLTLLNHYMYKKIIVTFFVERSTFKVMAIYDLLNKNWTCVHNSMHTVMLITK